ncbi:FKBP-type peptidyl-prolyl cis-trans isomerase [Aestuariibacter sp. AA17]|uniref:Peptidyl-prolyl cis-trans isomerase n=1 Tax=Fluctibacter corallii TaxID=2984329 RepID=A0ABT3AB15_9ALTE|nr:FKBP-type peptidyl-prolyl cis-trans isomerase [Aestuariibacter sp. AA17]MCV2885823.1 FKBP-type peptidyl-prolyl cis-trans isomerase [Aestuariibacter sp. AA17]
MKKAAIAMLVTSVIGLTACQQEKADPMLVEQVTLETDDQKQAYAIGANMGKFLEQNLSQQEEMGVMLDKSLIVKGFVAAIQDKGQLTEEEMQATLESLKTRTQEAMTAKAKADGEANLEEGKAYLAENAKREGVTTTDSGLQYEVMQEGEGQSPRAIDTVKVHYKGTLLDGTEFDSSYSRGEPAIFPLNRVIAGWTEGVQLMKPGAKYKFHIPSDLAYGERAAGQIPSNATLVFEVELLEVVKAEEPTTAE